MEHGIDGFTKKRVAEITQLTERQVQYYTEREVVTPDIDLGEGRGKTRLYSHHNLVQFMIIKEMAALGMTVSKIKFLLRYCDQTSILRDYENNKLYKNAVQFYVKIFIPDDEKLPVGWIMTSDTSREHSILTPADMTDYNKCIILNFGRIAAMASSK